MSRSAAFGERTTFRVGGPAAALLEIADLDALMAAAASISSKTAVYVLGRGSNTLVADRGFQGVVILLGEGFSSVDIRASADGDAGTVIAGAAADLPVVARRSVEAGLSGFEWAVGVPGSIGGAVRMNAGGHGSDMSASLRSVRSFDLDSGKLLDRPVGDLGLGYRRSEISAREVVLDATLGLERGDPARGRELIKEIVRWRREHQPGGQNCGSVFTNPPGDSAGRLIEAAGLKGFRLGSARVSEKHANFIQADPGGSADDVASLIETVVEVVRESSGISLVAEVRRVGFEERET